MRNIYVELANKTLFDYFKKELVEVNDVLDEFIECLLRNEFLEKENDMLLTQIEDIKDSLHMYDGEKSVDTQVD